MLSLHGVAHHGATDRETSCEPDVARSTDETGAPGSLRRLSTPVRSRQGRRAGYGYRRHVPQRGDGHRSATRRAAHSGYRGIVAEVHVLAGTPRLVVHVEVQREREDED